MPEQYSRSLEQEVKILLTEDEFERVLNRFSWEETTQQINYYYMDPEGKLSAERVNVRVRQKNGGYTLQVKNLVKNVAGGPSVHNEVEKKIDSLPQVIDARTVKDMTGIDTSSAIMVGELTTVRRVCRLGDKKNIEVCLDKSDYLGITDYELELEYTGDELETVKQIVQALGLSTSQQPRGKLSRFYSRYKTIKSE